MKFWDIVNSAAGSAAPARLTIYGSMGQWSDVDERHFVAALDAVTAKELDVYVGSPGGSVQTGLIVYNALRRFAARGTLRTHADGIVASAATLPFLAGDERVAPAGALLMVHQALTYSAAGNADELREQADLLEKVTASIADIYAVRAGLDKEAALALMKATTWMTASEAVAHGFATVAPSAGAVQAVLQGQVLNVAGRAYDLEQLPQMSAAHLAYMLGNAAALAPQTPPAASIVQHAGTAGSQKGEGPMDLEKLKAEHPEVLTAAMALGANAERARIEAINNATPSGFEADAAAAIQNGHTAEQFALALLQKQKAQGTTFLQNRTADAQGDGGANGAPADDGSTTEVPSVVAEFGNAFAAAAKARAGKR